MYFASRIVSRRSAALLSPAVLALGLAGVSAPAAAALDPNLPPSQNFNLANWKLTLPSGSDVLTDVLNSGFEYEPAFYTHPSNGGMVFRTPNIAGTTTNSSYSRSELREMLCPSCSATSDANNWTPEDGGVMNATLRVDRVSTTGDSAKVGRVVIGQIHAPETEVIRLYFHKLPGEARGRLYAGFDDVDNENTYGRNIVPNTGGDGISLGQKFTYRITLADTMLRVRIWANGRTYDYAKRVDSGYRGLNMYFKAGVYNQNNTGDQSDFVKATFFKLTHSHPFPAQ